MQPELKKEDIIKKIFGFLEALPISIRFQEINTETFLQGIKIESGTLLVDSKKLIHPGDMLHEAGPNGKLRDGNQIAQEFIPQRSWILQKYRSQNFIGLPLLQ